MRFRRTVPVYPDNEHFQAVASVEARSEFRFTLIPASEDELKAAFEQYVRKLESTSDPDAVAAITVVAPRFLEPMVLQLAENPRTAGPAVAGLGSLNTIGAREKLAELAEQSKQEHVRQDAIAALAATRETAVLPLLMRIARTGPTRDRELALWHMGILGQAAVPFLASVARGSDVGLRIAAIRGLGASGSRSAVPILIDLLRPPGGQMASDARVALSQLTHFSTGGNVSSTEPDEWSRWHNWWVLHGAIAQIFDTNHCSVPEPLP